MMHLDHINSMTTRRSFTHGLWSQCPAASPQVKVLARAVKEQARPSIGATCSQTPPVAMFEDEDCRIVSSFKQAIALTIPSLTAMDERLNQIELR
ncbi:hypothetical protein CJ030_MR0G020850 [Morella rubra]|uniref:Uncharacterized protein n=1 Tax=Morella rubra TaxID=262757 RepID=A0A6A1UGW8_9ROSI|nr:hypothetical protein CJ030_MR0G020850 [Morella rubra]